MGRMSVSAVALLLAAWTVQVHASDEVRLAPAPPTIRMMSFNIWSNWRDRDTSSRCPGIGNAIRKSDADVVLLQEYASDWKASSLYAGLKNDYEIVGGQGLAPLLYRRKRLRQLDAGLEFFKVGTDGSKGVSWAVLEDMFDGRRFIAFSTHFWHRNGPEGDAIREFSAKWIAMQVDGLRRKWGPVPAIGGGDLNSTTGSIACAVFRNAKWLNAMDVARVRTDRSRMCTYHDYPVKDAGGAYRGKLAPPEKNSSGNSIDHIFLTSGINVLLHDLDIDQQTLDASDHSPVIVDFTISGGESGRTLLLAGDSTLDASVSWGTVLGDSMKAGNKIRNFAKCGASTRSFLEAGRWAQLIDEVKPWDFVLIQFAHNDQKQSTEFYRKYRHAPARGLHRQCMARFVAEVREKGGIPIIATSLSRCTFDAAGRITDKPETEGGENVRTYAEADIELAKMLKTDVVDMNSLSSAFLEKEGLEKAQKMFVQKKDKDGKIVQDVSHPAKAGAIAFSKLFLEDVTRRGLPISDLFRPDVSSGGVRALKDRRME